MASDRLRANQNVEKFERYDEISVLMIRWKHHDWALGPDVTAPGSDHLRHEVAPKHLLQEHKLIPGVLNL